jgi:hypothetical protein
MASLSSLVICLRERSEDFIRKYLSDAPLLHRLLALHTNLRIDWRGLPVANTLAYCENSKITDVKFFITSAPEHVCSSLLPLLGL